MAEVLDSAAAAGYPDPDSLWHMTPAAMSRAIAAHGAQAARDDRRAWMAGYYFAIAAHAPRRFPQRPCLIRQAPQPMTEEQMRQVLMGFAAERSSIHDPGNPQNTVSGGDL